SPEVLLVECGVSGSRGANRARRAGGHRKAFPVRVLISILPAREPQAQTFRALLPGPVWRPPCLRVSEIVSA
ncbi:MAG TPA: hypothetical protein VHI52_14050, partial [Verrucomicrobiae bacterium]|nr:hypothetical protein [Verrucomicrobiae bacterium]